MIEESVIQFLFGMLSGGVVLGTILGVLFKFVGR